MTTQIVAGFFLALVTAAVSWRLGYLTPGGAAAQVVLGTLIFGLGGWGWAVPILFFFFLSSLLSNIYVEKRRGLQTIFEKGSTRDAFQVLANGGVAGACAILWAVTADAQWFVAYAGSVAAATADTWGTEVGVRSGRPPVLITSLRPAERGTSGAISPLGTLVGAAGSLCVGVCALPWSGTRQVLLPVLFAGVAGSLVDSILGATLQAAYRCQSCGRQTERKTHCGGRTVQTGGLAWIGNDLVNLACTATGALLALLLA